MSHADAIAAATQTVPANGAPPIPLVSSLVVDTAGEAVVAVCRQVLADGMDYRSSAQSMNAHKRIREILNCTVALRTPARRIADCTAPGFAFSPGLAAARFLYLLSGSDSYEQIAFYTNGASRFAGGGRSLPGSAYGARLFTGQANMFEETARTLLARPNTKRASVPIFQPHDTLAARHTPDLPCAFGLHFMLRDAGLISSVTMRANDAFKIMPYNLFEFSLLAECMAARIGVAYAAHVHGSVSMHLRDEGIAAAERLEDSALAPRAMPPVDVFNEDLRAAVCAVEAEIRAQGRGSRPERVLDRLSALPENGPWHDLLVAASLAGAAADGRGARAAEAMAPVAAARGDDLPLTAGEIARLLGGPPPA